MSKAKIIQNTRASKEDPESLRRIEEAKAKYLKDIGYQDEFDNPKWANQYLISEGFKVINGIYNNQETRAQIHKVIETRELPPHKVKRKYWVINYWRV